MALILYPIPGTMNIVINEGGLAAGAHTYRIVARVTTNLSTLDVKMSFYGKVELVAP